MEANITQPRTLPPGTRHHRPHAILTVLRTLGQAPTLTEATMDLINIVIKA